VILTRISSVPVDQLHSGDNGKARRADTRDCGFANGTQGFPQTPLARLLFPGLPRPGFLSSNSTGSRCSGLIVTEHEQPQSGRQIAVLTVNVDPADQIGQRHPAGCGDILQPSPECILKADACLVSCKHD
jgi:hypothetical protein